jgi:hypothetical protein
MNASLNLASSLELCRSVELARTSPRSEDDARGQFQDVLSLLEKGWTPYLHDAACRCSWPGGPKVFAAHLFAQHPGHGEIFDRLLEQFPLMALSFALSPGPEERSASRWMSPSEKTPASSWDVLGFVQKSALIDRAGEELLSPPNDPDQFQSWVRQACHVLMPKRNAFSDYLHAQKQQVEPFFGYFSSRAWISLQSSKPELASMLALHLFSLCSLVSMERSDAGLSDDVSNPSFWAQTALDADEGFNAAMPPGESWKKMSALPCAVLLQCLRRDWDQPAMALIKRLRLDPVQAETHHLNRCVGGQATFSNALAGSLSQVRPWAQALAQSNPKMADAFASDKLARLVPMSAGPMPMFSLCALSGAQKCWDALSRMFQPPLDAFEWTRHGVRVASPLEIRQRMNMQIELARDSGAATASLEAIRSNLEAEARRAESTLSRVELPPKMLAWLCKEEAPLAQINALAPLPPEGSPARERFERACDQALARMSQGKLRSANLDISLPYTWTSYLLASGAKPLFLEANLGGERLAASADVFDLGLAQGLRGQFNSDDAAILERAQLRTQSAQPSRPSSKTARL